MGLYLGTHIIIYVQPHLFNSFILINIYNIWYSLVISHVLDTVLGERADLMNKAVW